MRSRSCAPTSPPTSRASASTSAAASSCSRSDVGISFALTDEQRELQRLAHGFAERELRPFAAESDEREAYPNGLLGKAPRVGLTPYAIPREDRGGRGRPGAGGHDA